MKWDLSTWQQASDLLEQTERIQRNFLQIAANHFGALNSPAAASAPPVNVVETDQACWVITAIPGANADQIEIRLQGNEVIIAGMRQLPNLLRARRTEDLEEITPQAREGICFEFLTTVEDALRLALEPNSAAGFPASPRLAS